MAEHRITFVSKIQVKWLLLGYSNEVQKFLGKYMNYLIIVKTHIVKISVMIINIEEKQ
jgi:hypothetical protein